MIVHILTEYLLPFLLALGFTLALTPSARTFHRRIGMSFFELYFLVPRPFL